MKAVLHIDFAENSSTPPHRAFCMASLEIEIPFAPPPGHGIEHSVWKDLKAVRYCYWNVDEERLHIELEHEIIKKSEAAAYAKMYRSHGWKVETFGIEG